MPILISVGTAVRYLPPSGQFLRIFSSASQQSSATIRPAVANLYFHDGPNEFPVSRRVSSLDARRVLDSLLSGPPAGFATSIPSGTKIETLSEGNGTVRITFSREFSVADPRAHLQVAKSLFEIPSVREVVIGVEGSPTYHHSRPLAFVYFASAKGIVAVPARDRLGTDAPNPRTALDLYLSGPSDSHLAGLPSDVRLSAYDFQPATNALSLKFNFTPSLKELAVNKPDQMRFVLLGIIATMTDYPEVKTVQLDFEGHTRLGLGQCSDLLETPQTRPTLFNDERLLDR